MEDWKGGEALARHLSLYKDNPRGGRKGIILGLKFRGQNKLILVDRRSEGAGNDKFLGESMREQGLYMGFT